MDIEARVVVGGHTRLADVWVAEVPVPNAIHDSKDLVFFPLSRHISLGAVTLEGPVATTTTTSATATLAL